jgi:hypothetical protein
VRLAIFLAAVIICAPAALADTGFLDRTMTVGGQSYRFQVYVPADYTPDSACPSLWICMGTVLKGATASGRRPIS